MNRYAEMDKNTVDAVNQLKDDERVRFFNPNGRGKRILAVGNSITLHAPKPEIGWEGDYGMAASAADKDYFHRLMNKVNAVSPDCAFGICQAGVWESQYQNGEAVFELFEKARRFSADILIFRVMENCPRQNFDKDVFKKEAQKLIDFLDADGRAEVIFTTPFWHHPGEVAIEEMAAETHRVPVRLDDLGENPEMKAPGLFWHEGVANHPGDKGMAHIADRLFDAVKVYL